MMRQNQKCTDANPLGTFFSGVRVLWKEHPILTLMGSFFLFVFMDENHLFEPFLGLCFLFILLSFFKTFLSSSKAMLSLFKKNYLQEVLAMQKTPPIPPYPPHHFPPPMGQDPSFFPLMETRIVSLEKKVTTLQATEEDLLKRTEHLGKPKSRSFLAILAFCVGMGSLSVPLFLFGSIAFWKYLGRSELSPVFLSAFNHLHLDRLMAHVNLVDFDFFATFFGILLIPSLTLLLIGFFIPIRVLFKRQRGFFIALVACGMLFISTLSFVGMWKGLMCGAHQWNNILQQMSNDNLEPFKQTLQSPYTSFGKKLVAIKALKKADTEEAYQILFESLEKNNAVLQQLIFENLQNRLTLEQILPIEKLLQQTQDRRFQHLGVELISTVPDKQVAYKLLEYDVPLSVHFLRERFTTEDIPQLQEKLYDPQIRHKAPLLQVLYSLDVENTVKTLEVFVASHEEESQRAALQVIANNIQNPVLKPLLNKLIQSQFHSIHHDAKRLWKRYGEPRRRTPK